MKYFNQFGLVLLLVLSVVLLTNCERVIVDGPLEVTPQPDALTYINDNADIKLLAELIKTSGLDQKLGTDGPFTLFAPTDEAFNRLISDNEAWNNIDDIPEADLKAILDYHFVNKRLILRDTFFDYIETSRSTNFDAFASLFVKSEGSIRLNGERNVALQDVRLTNGIIHLLDEVIPTPNVVTFISTNPELSNLSSALSREDLSIDFVETLSQNGPYTIFAPSDSAFIDLLADLGLTSVEQIPADILENVLLYHVSDMANLRDQDLINDSEISTLSGSNTFKIATSGTVKIIDGQTNNAMILTRDAQATNGVVHVIDKVLLTN